MNEDISSSIDFSKAPEGATHYYLRDGEVFCWYKVYSGGYEFFYEDDYLWGKPSFGTPAHRPYYPIPKQHISLKDKTEVTQDDLIAGLHVVEFEDYYGLYLFLGNNVFVGLSGDWRFLGWRRNAPAEIIRVWEHKPVNDVFIFGSERFLSPVWRKPEPVIEPEEMTLEEVCKALGKAIKIISG